MYEHEVNFEFGLSIIIWYDILLNVNTVSKSLQNPKTNLLTVDSLLKGLKNSLKYLRNVGFAKLKVEAEKLCEKYNVPLGFKKNRIRKRKRHFDYEDDSGVNDSEINFHQEHK